MWKIRMLYIPDSHYATGLDEIPLCLCRYPAAFDNAVDYQYDQVERSVTIELAYATATFQELSATCDQLANLTLSSSILNSLIPKIVDELKETKDSLLRTMLTIHRGVEPSYPFHMKHEYQMTTMEKELCQQEEAKDIAPACRSHWALILDADDYPPPTNTKDLRCWNVPINPVPLPDILSRPSLKEDKAQNNEVRDLFKRAYTVLWTSCEELTTPYNEFTIPQMAPMLPLVKTMVHAKHALELARRLAQKEYDTFFHRVGGDGPGYDPSTEGKFYKDGFTHPICWANLLEMYHLAEKYWPRYTPVVGQ
ncbi:hypothetical protein BT63DRAFT_477477 [Microthyrium microscopicum]|uniref:Uncharacterized protein n=1 Tax=Microthyrium microscopicum TaxID=703497 RepID=A0A6A6UJ41_9PEZI|nr:hypothetical protein BT63DRAFT_477477 [Microthyrium microscopicum]